MIQIDVALLKLATCKFDRVRFVESRPSRNVLGEIDIAKPKYESARPFAIAHHAIRSSQDASPAPIPYNPPIDLFHESRQKNLARAAPLPVRLRPRTLEEFVGQAHFLGEGKLLRRMLEADRLTSVIFYGPPGTGKTTLAQLVATYTKSHFEQVNAAAVGVKEVRAILDAARERLGNSGQRTVLFLDEIHRFNRAQQDILLPDVEAGHILLVGATTENPFFAVNSPLVSRSQIFQFSALTEEDIRLLIRRAIADKEN